MIICRMKIISIKLLLLIFWCCFHNGITIDTITSGIKTQSLKQQQGQLKAADYESYYNKAAIVEALPSRTDKFFSTENQHITKNIITDYYLECPSQYTGPLPYAYDCRRFLNCWHGKGHVQTCAVGTVFNPETLECDRPHKVKCGAALSTDHKKRSAKLIDTTTDHVELLCASGQQGLQQHPTDCTKFINCANGNVHIQQCGPGTAFSPTMLVCVHKDKANCAGQAAGVNYVIADAETQKNIAYVQSHIQQQQQQQENQSQHDTSHSKDILCPPDITGLFPYPFDYTKFINCKSGNTAIQNCMPGLAFNIFKGFCEPLNEMPQSHHVRYIVSEVSHEFSQTLVSCPPGTEGLHLYPYDAEKYIQCSQGQMIIMHCPETKVYSLGKHSCLSQNLITKEDRVRLVWELQQNAAYRINGGQSSSYNLQNMIYCPIGSSGIYPHPFDCSKYLKCVNGRLISESCNSGSAYSLSRRICDTKDVVNSQDRIPTVPSVMHNLDYNYDHTYLQSLNDGLTYLVCPPGVEGYFVHPFDCTKYLECRQGETKVRTCANGSVYSISRQQCVARDQVEAYDRVEYKTTVKNEFTENDHQQHHYLDYGITCKSGAFEIYGYPKDSHKFMRCANGRLTIENCPYNQEFNVERGFCHEPSNNYNKIANSGGSYDGNYEGQPAHATYDTGRSYNRHHEATSVQTTYDSGRYYNRNHETTSTQPLYEPAYHLPKPSSSTTEMFSNKEPYYGLHQPSRQATGTARTTITNTATQSVNYYPPRSNISHQAPSKSSVYHNVQPSVHRQIVPTFFDSHSVSSNVDIQNVYNKEINCPQDGQSSLLPHPYDCTKFIMCSNGIAHVQNCAPGTAWNPSMETCDYASNMNCVSPTSSEKEYFTCPPGINGPYQHPYDWHKFLICNNGKGMIMDCAPGTVFSISMRICKADNLVPNTDRCNEGTAISTHTYNQNIIYGSREGKNVDYKANSIQTVGQVPLAPMPKVHGDVESGQHAIRNRWSAMNKPRPSVSDQRSSWSQTGLATVPKQYPSISDNTLAWSGGAIHVDQHAPVHTVIQEEGSFEPNRNTHVQTFNTPLAPFPKTPTTSATPLQNFNEQFLVVDNHFQGYPTYSTAHSTQRHYNHSSSENRRTLINSPPSSVYHSPTLKIYTDDDLGQRTLPEDDQFSSESRQVKVSVDESNLYGGLQSPAPTQPTYRFTETHQQIPKPSKSTSTTTSTLTPVYRKLSNATIQTFPRQPHYTSAYSTVTHSRNVTRINDGALGRKIPQHSLIKPPPRDRNNQHWEATNPQLSAINYENAGHSNPKDVEGVTDVEADDLPISDALKLLLRPYTSASNVNSTDAMMEKAERHIMNLAKQSNKDIIETTTTTTTATIKPLILKKTKNDKDVELILAGEQPSLVNGVTNSDSESKILMEDDLQSIPNRLQTNDSHYDHHKWHKHHHNSFHRQHHHQHSLAFHKAHPHLPNPFASEEPELENSDSDKPINPQVDITTPESQLNIDLRSGLKVCPFDCGHNKCITDHEVCNGIDNCGNRLDELYCDHLGYEVRLTGGESSHMGRIEIKILDKWGYVCDDKFGLRDADVLCKEIGFKAGALEVRGNSYYPPADLNPAFMMDEVDCHGNEMSLKDCAFKGWGVHNCGPDEVVGVVCKVPKLKCPDNYWLCSTSKECIPTAFVCDVTPDCSDGSDENPQICNASIEYRLEGGRHKTEGRLEVLYRGEWGTVCDDDFTLNEAQVVCNSLGYYGKAEVVKNIYGPGNGPIWLDQVSCIGNETALDKCNHWTWGENNCNHTEDVCIKCSPGIKPNPVLSINMEYDHTNDQQYSSELDDSDFDVKDMYQNLWQRSSKAIKVQKRCGQFKTDLLDEYEHPEERVINGTVAKKGRHPWQATIRVRGRGGISNHWCGAVLISKRLLLTAAHCLYGYAKGSYYVRLGDHYANIAETSELDSFIENWYIHEKFRDQKPMNNDIALVLLKNKVRFNDYIQPVCLPDKDSPHLKTNRLCTISGWGSIKSGESTPSNVLRSAQVPILSDEICQQKNVYGGKMTDNMFCAGSLDESVDACDGDSGGPLVCTDQDGETLYGIISWGQHCGYANRPGVYVRIEKYIDWIHEKINLMIQQGKL